MSTFIKFDYIFFGFQNLNSNTVSHAAFNNKGDDSYIAMY